MDSYERGLVKRLLIAASTRLETPEKRNIALTTSGDLPSSLLEDLKKMLDDNVFVHEFSLSETFTLNGIIFCARE